MGTNSLTAHIADFCTRRSIQQLADAISVDAEPVYTGLTLTGLTASRLIATDASDALASVGTLSSWVAGTANEIDVADDGDGTITIGLVNPLIVGKGGTGVSTLTTAYGLLAAGTTATGAVQTLAAGLTTEILVGGGAAALPAWGADLPTAVTIGAKYIYRADGTDVPVADGGTGASTLTDHGILLGSGTAAITPLGAATNGQLPIGSTGYDPVLAALTGTANQITVTNGAGSITLSGPQDLHTGASPTFAGLSLGTGELTCGSINRAADTLTIEIGGVPQISITDTTCTFAGSVNITGTTTFTDDIIIPNDGWIGSVDTNEAIQITATGSVYMPEDLTITGHVIFDTDSSHIGYTDNSPMAVFNNADDRVEITGGLTISSTTTGVGNITTTGGELRSGVEDTTRGYCRLFGQATSNVWGGSLYLGTSADYDTTIDSYILSAYEDDFVIQNGGAGNLFKIAGADNAATLIGTLTTGGTVTTDAGDSTEWDAAYDHSLVTSGNPHSVTSAELGLEIGTDVQAYDAELAAIAALATTDGNIIVGDGATWVAESGATARTSLGLGTGDSPTFTNLYTSGNIGVKTSSPASGLDAQTKSLILGSDNATEGLRTDNTAKVFQIFGFPYANTEEYVMAYYFYSSATLDRLILGGGSGAANALTDIQFYTGAKNNLSGTERMRIGSNGYVSIGTAAAANEVLEVSGKIRANTAFNLNGTDGVTQAAAAGTVCDVTALAGGIATAQTQITYAANGTYNFDATSGKVDSITITNGRITAITTVA